MRLFFVIGKGGVGKTTITSALAHPFRNNGGVLVVTIDQPDQAAHSPKKPFPPSVPQQLSDGFWTIHLDRDRCLHEFISGFLKINILSRWILDHPIFPYITGVAPGIREYLVLDRLRTFTRSSWQSSWHTIIVDAPATGHGVHLLQASAPLATILKFGPLRSRITKTDAMIHNPHITRAILVTIPEELPVQETIELHAQLHRSGIPIHAIVINQCEHRSLGPRESAIWKNLSTETDPLFPDETDSPPLIADRFRNINDILDLQEKRYHLSVKNIQRLKRAITGSFIEIPFIPEPEPSRLIAQMTPYLDCPGILEEQRSD